jgi:Predicted transcriptional regulators
MPQEDTDETYSVIYAALKHPLRRRILRMLNQEELTYTQILNKLDVDTGHLNYYLESLGELVVKTPEGKYRLSEYGKAAVKLMAGVEETEPSLAAPAKRWFSKRKITRLTQVVCIIALILTGAFLMTITTVRTYWLEASGSLDNTDTRVLAPNETISSIDYLNVRGFPTDTLTTHYRTFLQIELANVNVSLQVQVTESIYPSASFPADEYQAYVQNPLVIYNQAFKGPYGSEDEVGSYLFSKLGQTILVPIKSPQEKGMLVSNSFAQYTTNVTNLGVATLVRNPQNYSQQTSTNITDNTGTLNLKVSYPLIERTDYPYFYYGLTLISLATVTYSAVLSAVEDRKISGSVVELFCAVLCVLVWVDLILFCKWCVH